MKLSESITGGIAATASVGIPDDAQNAIIQLVVGVITGLLIKLFNRIGKKNGTENK